MTRDELLAIALRHGFGHCEVGIRMLGLVHEIIETCAQDCDAVMFSADELNDGIWDDEGHGSEYLIGKRAGARQAGKMIRERITG